MPFASQHIKVHFITYITDAKLGHLTELVFVMFFHWKVVSMYSPHSGGDIMVHSAHLQVSCDSPILPSPLQTHDKH